MIYKNMYNDEIEEELKECDSFVGVYMADTVPSLDKFNDLKRGIIINLDSSSQSGSHWVSFWNEGNGFGEYFDSFGLQPPGNIAACLKVLCPNQITFSKQPLQHTESNACGLYAIFFIKHKCLGLSFSCILSHFSRSRGLNEIIISTLKPVCE